MSKRIDTLADAVALLASDPVAQLQHLRGLGLPEGIDELALEYEDIAAAADDMLQLGELNKNQYDSVKKLDDLVSRMSGITNSQLWTTEGLSSALEWKEVRRLAKECLRLLEVNR